MDNSRSKDLKKHLLDPEDQETAKEGKCVFSIHIILINRIRSKNLIKKLF